MKRISGGAVFWLILSIVFCATYQSQTRPKSVAAPCSLNGSYRVDTAASDKLYSVVEDAASKVSSDERQKFFTDLSVRLTPPDILSIECSGKRVTVGSSRAQPVTFVADGVTRTERRPEGYVVRSRVAFENENLTFKSSGKAEDNVNVTFAPLENGRRLQVTRYIYAEQLAEPIVIKTVYNKVTDVARRDVYESETVGRQTANENQINSTSGSRAKTRAAQAEMNDANSLRNALDKWIEATNNRDIEKQMSFYMPELQAFYLARNVSRNSVRAEKNRAVANARSIDIRAAEPEIIFQDAGRTAVMRFRKKYNVTDKQKTRSGEVVQELRWQQTNSGWQIFSERDIRVVR